MTKTLRTGASVRWHWGSGTARGRIEEVFLRPVSRTIKGKRIRRNASDARPAYLVRQADGATALKSHSEVEPLH